VAQHFAVIFACHAIAPRVRACRTALANLALAMTAFAHAVVVPAGQNSAPRRAWPSIMNRISARLERSEPAARAASSAAAVVVDGPR
jgi:hypothetical protein